MIASRERTKHCVAAPSIMFFRHRPSFSFCFDIQLSRKAGAVGIQAILLKTCQSAVLSDNQEFWLHAVADITVVIEHVLALELCVVSLATPDVGGEGHICEED